jgi:hypothetical protein
MCVSKSALPASSAPVFCAGSGTVNHSDSAMLQSSGRTFALCDSFIVIALARRSRKV